MIKSIPTKYDGIEYRSRTEARWAVFFDRVGIRFDYEREGYETSLGWYVPDFWLPCSGCWIEIKGTDDEHSEHIDKLFEVCSATQSYGFVFVGVPIEMRGSFVGCDDTGSSCGPSGSRFDAGIARASKSMTEVFLVNMSSREYWDASMTKMLDCVWSGDYRDEWDEWGVRDAAEFANKHRFW